VTVSLCLLAHKRTRAHGEVWADPDGTEHVSDGTETVRDYARKVGGHADGALLCTGHYSRLTEIVATTPAVVAHLRSLVAPGAPAREDTSRGAPQGKRTPAPLTVDAVDAADAEVELLHNWCRLVADELGVELPAIRGAWLGPNGVVRGIRAADTSMVDDLTRWLAVRLDWACDQPWVDDMLTELGEVRGRHLRRWPVRDTARRLRGHPCPTCERLTLVLHPPTNDGSPVLVVCADRRCGGVLSQDRWEWASKVAEEGTLGRGAA
jgi:hypothetical protein